MKTPVVPEPTTFVTPLPPSCGLLLVAVGAKTTPRAVIAEPPSLVTVPPRVALVEATAVAVGEVTVGADAVSVVKLPIGL